MAHHFGAEDSYGPHATRRAWREVVLKVAVRHEQEQALEIFAREIYPAATAMAQGIGGIFGGRPKVQPVMRLYSFLLPKEKLVLSLRHQGRSQRRGLGGLRRQRDPDRCSGEPHRSAASRVASVGLPPMR